MRLEDYISVIESVPGFTNEDTPVGEAWAFVLRRLHDAEASNAHMRKALQIQQDESDLQMQGYRLCDDPSHPTFVKWLGPAKEGETGLDRHWQLSALRRSMRTEALSVAKKERDD